MAGVAHQVYHCIALAKDGADEKKVDGAGAPLLQSGSTTAIRAGDLAVHLQG